MRDDVSNRFKVGEVVTQAAMLSSRLIVRVVRIHISSSLNTKKCLLEYSGLLAD